MGYCGTAAAVVRVPYGRDCGFGYLLCLKLPYAAQGGHGDTVERRAADGRGDTTQVSGGWVGIIGVVVEGMVGGDGSSGGCKRVHTEGSWTRECGQKSGRTAGGGGIGREARAGEWWCRWASMDRDRCKRLVMTKLPRVGRWRSRVFLVPVPPIPHRRRMEESVPGSKVVGAAFSLGQWRHQAWRRLKTTMVVTVRHWQGRWCCLGDTGCISA